MSNILFIDDDTDSLEINKKFFIKEGYFVETCFDPKKVLALISSFKPDCIILDVMMPSVNGFELCRQIRKSSTTPIIFLTGRSGEKDKINGLLIGADDYMIKPFSFKELSARIQVQIRRYQVFRATMLNFPPLSLNLENHKAFYGNEELNLSNREYELLHLLLTSVNQVVTYKDISSMLWGFYSEEDNKTIMVIASRLRKKLEQYNSDFHSIESVRSKGYIYYYK